jgi:hypothetical protein
LVSGGLRPIYNYEVPSLRLPPFARNDYCIHYLIEAQSQDMTLIT